MSPKRARPARGSRPPQRPRPSGSTRVAPAQPAAGPAQPTAKSARPIGTPAGTEPVAARELPEAWPFSRLPEPWGERALLTVATVVLGWAGFVLAVLGVFWTPLMIGTVRVPVSILLAVGGNLGLIWLGWRLTRHRFLALVPGLIWAVVALLGANITTEGDLLLASNNWVALVFLLSGSVAVGFAAYRLILTGRSGRPPHSMY